MKQLYALTLVASMLALLLGSCQKELHFPEVPPTSFLKLTKDSTTYNLKFDSQSIVLKDTAQLKMIASSPEITIILDLRSANHKDGVGEYFLWCCNNDVFDKTSGSQKHWEIDHIGNRMQAGSVNITRYDSKGYAGTYSIYAKDYDVSRTAVKEFKGSFEVFF